MYHGWSNEGDSIHAHGIQEHYKADFPEVPVVYCVPLLVGMMCLALVSWRKDPRRKHLDDNLRNDDGAMR